MVAVWQIGQWGLMSRLMPSRPPDRTGSCNGEASSWYQYHSASCYLLFRRDPVRAPIGLIGGKDIDRRRVGIEIRAKTPYFFSSRMILPVGTKARRAITRSLIGCALAVFEREPESAGNRGRLDRANTSPQHPQPPASLASGARISGEKCGRVRFTRIWPLYLASGSLSQHDAFVDA